MTEIHITADTDVWTGASTTALLAAMAAADGVVISAGSGSVVSRLEKGGVRVVQCPMGGIFGPLNLSRALRHVSGNSFEIYVHSPAVVPAVESALKLVGRKESMTLMPGRPMPAFPAVEVEHPAPGGEPLLMWLGNITDGCGLGKVVEELGENADKPWRLRVVGQGKASVVSPILKRTKALGIADRIEWAGHADNPYEHMNGVTAAIVADKASVVAHEFAAASVPVYTKLSEIL